MANDMAYNFLRGPLRLLGEFKLLSCVCVCVCVLALCMNYTVVTCKMCEIVTRHTPYKVQYVCARTGC